MSLRINDIALDFTPVCTTELGTVTHLMPEFERRNCKFVGLSIDPVDNHADWANDIQETQGAKVNFPMIADTDLAAAMAYDMFLTDITGTTFFRCRYARQVWSGLQPSRQFLRLTCA